MLHITTRIEGRKHDDLLGDKAERMAFPSVVLMTETGEALTQVHGMSLDGYKKLVNTANNYVAAKKKVDSGDASAKVEFAIAGATLGKLDLQELDELLDGIKLTDAQAVAVKQVRANAAFSDLLASARARGRDPDFRKYAVGECKKIYQGGVHPNTPESYQYWLILADDAKTNKNVNMMETCVKALHKMLGANPRAANLLKKMDSDLAALKAEAAKKPAPADDEDDDTETDDEPIEDDG